MFPDDSEDTIDQAGGEAATAELRDPPTEADPLALKWNQRLERSIKHWDKFFKRVKHNRNLVAGFDWSKDPNNEEFYKLRANLIQGTITAVLPNIYARNPEISVSQNHKTSNLKLTCETLQKVINVSLEKAKLKQRAKSVVRSALTNSYGAAKVMYQRDTKEDPVIVGRLNDTQDNIERIELLIAKIEDPAERSEQEARQAELNELMRSLDEKREVVVAEGLVIDRVFTEHLLIDETITDFFDYPDSDWMAQIIPMKKSQAEARYGFKLNGATPYQTNDHIQKGDRRLASGTGADKDDDDAQICIYEIWDKTTQTVYTIAAGCTFWLRPPYSPEAVGERWYPFFLLPYQVVDGQFIAPSLVDLTEKLQGEHNEARNKLNDHRKLCVPGWMMSSEIKEKSIRRFEDSQLGEITLVDTDGKPLNQAVMPRPYPPIDPMVYDTSSVRMDWEQVTGMQDAARSTVSTKTKTATEAAIMNQALSGRVSEFRDQVEDFLQEIALYSGQVLLIQLPVHQVARIMGDDIVHEDGTVQRQYDWPELTREEIFDLVSIQIRAGSTGVPDKLESQENWIKLLPVIQPLIDKIYQLRSQGMDAAPFVELLKETIMRFDDKLDVENFLIKLQAPIPQPPVQPPPQLQGA